MKDILQKEPQFIGFPILALMIIGLIVQKNNNSAKAEEIATNWVNYAKPIMMTQLASTKNPDDIKIFADSLRSQFLLKYKTDLTNKFKNIGSIPEIFFSNFIYKLNGEWCTPNCSEPMGAIKFNDDGTFNSSNKMFGGMSRWGTWESYGYNRFLLKTDKISTNNANDKRPGPQIISIKSNNLLEVGSTKYLR